jgi:glycosyltransferase involved in cell wall biosynthesis
VGRIIYLSRHPKNEISGGIKMHYRHVEMLVRMGFDAWVSVSGGHNDWFKSGVRVFNGQTTPDDIVVFPEVLNGVLGEMSKMPARCSKVLLCQNQYYMFSETISKHSLAELNFAKHVTVGETARRYLERVFAPSKFDVVPVFVDSGFFHPGDKQARIAVIPRKLPNEYRIIRSIFLLKYPALRGVPWDVIEQKTESEVAESLGRATVFLSLCNLECAPLTPLEAMASGCVVVGFHGYGGQDYANAQNGLWLRPDFLEETADALAEALLGIERGDPKFTAMRSAGIATARSYSETRTENSLREVFSELTRA